MVQYTYCDVGIKCEKFAAFYLQKNLFKALAAIIKLLIEVCDDVLNLLRVDIAEIVPCINLAHLGPNRFFTTLRPSA